MSGESRHHARLPDRGAMPYRRLLSPLYCRLNGFMLGVFLRMCESRVAARRYPSYRARMQTFLSEIDVPVTIPRNFEHADWGETATQIAMALNQRSKRLLDFCMLGNMATSYVFLARSNRPDAEIARRLAHELMQRHGIPFAWFDDMVPPDSKPPRTAEDVVSPPLALLKRCLEVLAPERNTCFIAMPFRQPFERYYARFYRPLLWKAGFRAIRAWGGFGTEDFSPLLVVTILRSGLMFGDITKGSPNVLWEVGVAQGAGKQVFLARNANLEAPADLAKSVSLAYDPSAQDWVARIIDAYSASLHLLSFASRQSPRGAMHAATGLRQKQVDAAATRMQDVAWSASVFASGRKFENDPGAHIHRGMERMKAKRWNDAESDFTFAIRKGRETDRGIARWLRGLVRSELRRDAEAERDLSLASGAGTDVPLLWYARAVSRYRLARYAPALEDLNAALATEPGHLHALQLRALTFAHLGDVDRCKEDCRNVQRTAPEHPATHAACGYLALLRGRYAEAVDRFRRARGRSFGKAWHFEAALAELLAGRGDAAQTETEKGLLRATDADIDDALNELAFLLKTVPEGEPSRGRLAARFRRRLLEVRTPKRWAASSRKQVRAGAAH